MPLATPLLYAASTASADLRWFSGYACGDPFLAFGAGGRRYGYLPGLEVEPARAESRLDEVHDLGTAIKELREATGNEQAGLPELVARLRAEHAVERFTVPRDFPAGLFQKLAGLGCAPTVADGGLFAERALKTDEEAEHLRAANAAAAAGFDAVRRILSDARIEGDSLLLGREPVTAEMLRHAVSVACAQRGALCVDDCIAAPGTQAVNCHCRGFGPVGPGQLIVVDIFPQLTESGYFGDMTRTFLKGRPTPEQERQVAAVREVQQTAVARMVVGEKVAEIHKAVQERFKELGYENIEDTVPKQGYTHGLGHGVGLQVHESATRPGVEELEIGSVVTVEPGLYYFATGGCRIEDVVRVTADGPEMLSCYPYDWVID